MNETFHRLQTASFNDELRRQTIRSAFMDELYRRSGRTSGHYTGLWQEFQDQCLQTFASGLADRARERWAEDQDVLVIGGEEGNG